MSRFISRGKIFQKLTFLSIVGFILVAGLGFYYFNREFIENFKWYYLRSYAGVYDFKINKAYLAMANQFNFLNQIVVEKSVYTNNKENGLSVPILLYHGITPEADRFNHTTENFRREMISLKKAGYQTINLDDLLMFLEGKKTLPTKSFVLTFDDGRKDSFYPVDPILRELDFTAVMFVPIKQTLDEGADSSYYLSPTEMKKMVESGRWFIESHAIQKTGGHIEINSQGDKGNFLSNKAWLPDLNRLESDEEFEQRIEKEIFESKKALEDRLGILVKGFSYPFGDYGQQNLNYPNSQSVIANLVRKYYQLSFYQVWPSDRGYTHNYQDEDRIFLKRIEPHPDWKEGFLLSYLENGQPKKLPYEDDFLKDNGWKKTWGDYEISNRKLNVKSDPSTTGSFILLDGTYLWKDYLFSAYIDWLAGSHVVLVANHYDANNYLSCSFGNDGVRIRKNINGEDSILAENKTNFQSPLKLVKFGMALQGNKIVCLVEDQPVLITKDSNLTLSHGGIAIKTWDQNPGETSIIVKKVEVFPSETIDNSIFELKKS